MAKHNVQKELMNERPHELRDIRHPKTREIEPFSISLVLSAPKLLKMEIPRREELIDGLLLTRSLGVVFARRGVGKTYLTLSMANSIASGKDFLCWKVPKARRCLYVDGELPAADLQERVRQICDSKPPPLLHFISSESFFDSEQEALTLNNETHQRRFLALLDELEEKGRRPEVIFFDNLSSLTYGIDENSNSDQDPFLRFLRQLRHRGYTVIFIHHTGKNNEQRGASRREDFLDISIKLATPPSNAISDGNARFVLELSKIRRKMPERSRLVCELQECEDGRLFWDVIPLSVRVTKAEKCNECLRYIDENKPKSQKEIAEAFGVGKSTVSKWIAKFKKQGWLKGKALTAEGKKLLADQSEQK